MTNKLQMSKEKLDELVEMISLTHFHVISGIPKNKAISFKENLESREELEDYKFAYEKPLKEMNVLSATKLYGGQANA